MPDGLSTDYHYHSCNNCGNSWFCLLPISLNTASCAYALILEGCVACEDRERYDEETEELNEDNEGTNPLNEFAEEERTNTRLEGW